MFSLASSRVFSKIKWRPRLHRNISSSPESLPSPLSGVRILDMTRVMAGPFATMILGDLGAEVIKVEKPITGDDTRHWGPPFLDGKDGSRESAYFLCLNRNKQSIAVDITKTEGRDVIWDLAKESDVLIENYIPGKLDKFGLGYQQIKEISPKLVYCSITGFGPDGPYKDRAGYDVIAASMGGLMGVTGERNGGPSKVGVAVTDLATSLYAHGAILAALLQREKTGLGQKLDLNLLSTQVSLMVNLASNYLNAGAIPSRWGTSHASIVPYQSFPTQDGHMTIGCGNDRQFSQLCDVINQEGWPKDPRYATNEARVANRDQLEADLCSILATKTTKEWMGLFAKGVAFPYGPVNDMKQVFEDEQVIHSGMRQQVEHSTVGTVEQVGPAVRFSSSNNSIRSPPPTLGQHTDTVLSNLLGYDQDRIQQLRERKIIS